MIHFSCTPIDISKLIRDATRSSAETVVYLNIRVQHEGLNHSVLFAELYGDEQQTPAQKEAKYALVSNSAGFV